MNIQEIIKSHFDESIQAKQHAQEKLVPQIEKAVQIITNTFRSKHKLLICGNGGSAADSQHFAAEFTGRFEIERPPLPAIALTTDTSALTAIGNDYNFDVVFSKQVEALGQKNDVLFAISTSGNSKNVIKAIEVAHNLNMQVIALTGKDGGKIATMLKPDDVNICVNHSRTARIQEVHILVLHTICDLVDKLLFQK